jgi:hypothetical protein
MDKDTGTDLAGLQKLGITPVTFSPDEQPALVKLFANVGTAWGEELDRRGKTWQRGSEGLPGGRPKRAQRPAVTEALVAAPQVIAVTHHNMMRVGR